MAPPIFHLSLPVRDLAAARDFYVRFLGASVGRDNGQWADIVLFGHQLTLHQRPDEVLTPELRGVRHFGVILPWEQWQVLVDGLAQEPGLLLHPPAVAYTGTERKQGKVLLCDPSDNLIEIKAYMNLAAVLGQGQPG